MADLTSIEHIGESVVKQLGIYLKDEIRYLKKVLDEFPSDNRRLEYPSISIITTDTRFRSMAPYISETTAPDVNHKILVKYVVGFYDIDLQLDLWARNKEERNDIFNLLFNALNPNINPMGVSLQLTDYYDQYCQYDFIGSSIEDNEQQAQRREWRIKIDILTNAKALLVKEKYAMTDLTQPEHEISDDVVVPE